MAFDVSDGLVLGGAMGVVSIMVLIAVITVSYESGGSGKCRDAVRVLTAAQQTQAVEQLRQSKVCP